MLLKSVKYLNIKIVLFTIKLAIIMLLLQLSWIQSVCWLYIQSVCWYNSCGGCIYSLYVGTNVVQAVYTVCMLMLLYCWLYIQSVCWYYCCGGRIYSLYVGTTVVVAVYTVCMLVLLLWWPYIQSACWYYCCGGRIYRLLSFNRTQSSVVIGLIAHNTLIKHRHLVELNNSLLCRTCWEQDETSAHIPCECEALALLRLAYLGSFYWTQRTWRV